MEERMIEESFVMIKPDGFKKKIFKAVIERFLSEGLSIKDIDILTLDKQLVDEHYSHLVDKSFYPIIRDFMLSGPVIRMTVFGENAVLKIREIIGATDPKKAKEGTIRAMYGDKEIMSHNVIHASDSIENARLEIERFDNYQKRLSK